jgi:hypothetical protein
MGNVSGNVSPPGGVRPCAISDGRVSDSPGPVGAHQRGAARATDGVLLLRILRGWASAGRKVGMRRRARRCGRARPALVEPDELGRASNTELCARPSDRLYRLCLPMGFFTKLTRTVWGVPVRILVVLVKDLAGVSRSG